MQLFKLDTTTNDGEEVYINLEQIDHLAAVGDKYTVVTVGEGFFYVTAECFFKIIQAFELKY